MFYRTIEDISAECALPISSDFSALKREVRGRGFALKNPLFIQPMEGCDGLANGSPGELTYRRYARFADGGAGLIWAEAISVCEEGRANPRQLMLTNDNVAAFRGLTDIAHARGVPIIAQLTHSGRFSKPRAVRATRNAALDSKFNIPDDYPIISDAELDALPDMFARAANLAIAAGFDGVDVKCCHLYLFSELLGAYERPGKYGGSYENRARLLKDSVSAVKAVIGGNILASRVNLADYEAGRWGSDAAEPLRLISELSAMGVAIINITMGTPYLNPHINRPHMRSLAESGEHPALGVYRLIDGANRAQAVAGETLIAATGFSYLRQFAPYFAAGMIDNGGARLAGFGRMAFAYPDFANDIINEGGMRPEKCCIACSLCTKIMRAGGFAGCPVRDQAIYLNELRRATGAKT